MYIYICSFALLVMLEIRTHTYVTMTFALFFAELPQAWHLAIFAFYITLCYDIC